MGRSQNGWGDPIKEIDDFKKQNSAYCWLFLVFFLIYCEEEE